MSSNPDVENQVRYIRIGTIHNFETLKIIINIIYKCVCLRLCKSSLLS